MVGAWWSWRWRTADGDIVALETNIKELIFKYWVVEKREDGE